MPVILKQPLILLSVVIFGIAAVSRAEMVHTNYDLGVFAYEEGDYKGAESFLTKAAQENPTDAYVNYYLGKTYVKLNRPADADVFYKKARQIDANIPGLSYDMGVLNYDLKNYREALALFETVIAANPSDVLAVYHAGICLFMLEDYSKSAEYLLRSSELSPSVKPNAYYYIGVGYYKRSEYDQAIEKLSYVEQNAETKSLREDSAMWLQIIQTEKARTKPYQLYIKAGIQHDDNVNLAPVNSDVLSGKSDTAAVGYFSGRYALVKKGPFDLGVGYSHYQTAYSDLSQYDLISSIPEVYSEFRLNPVTLGLSYTPSYYWVDGESYLMQHQVVPSIRWQINDKNDAALSYGYYRNHYFTDSGRDGHTNEITLDFDHGLTSLKGYLFCGAGYEDNTASSRDEYYKQGSATLGLSFNVLDATNLTVYGAYYDKQYDHTDSVYKVKRKDSRYFASASVTRRIFSDWLSLSAEYTYTNNDSNIADYDYDRNTIAAYVVVNK